MRSAALMAAALLGCRGQPAAPVKPPTPAPPRAAAGAATPEAAVAADLEDPEVDIDCKAFAGDGPQLCLVLPASPEKGAEKLDFVLVLVAPAPGGGWRVADKVQDDVTGGSPYFGEAEVELSAELGERHELAPAMTAIEVTLQSDVTMDAEGGGNQEKHSTTRLYWHRSGKLVLLLETSSQYQADVDFDGFEEQTFEVQEERHGGVRDVVVSTHKVRNSWPVNEHSDETESELLTWDGEQYDRQPIENEDGDGDEDGDEDGDGDGDGDE